MQKKLTEKLEKMKVAFEQGFKGTITNVEEVTNREFFKDKGSYDEKNGIAITVKLNTDDGAEFKNFMAIPSTLGYAKSNIGMFEKKYGSYPKENMEVDVIINDDGFYRIVF